MNKPRSFLDQLEAYLPGEGEWEQLLLEKEGSDTEADPALQRSRRRKMAPEAEIDLHGLTRMEAETALDRFFTDSRRKGLCKILVIHGKGKHSGSTSVLPDFVKKYLQDSPYAGETGTPDRLQGGSGATWVLLK